MPVIRVETWPKDSSNKKKIIQGITKVFTELGVPEDHITVILNEIPRDNWALAGKYQGGR